MSAVVGANRCKVSATYPVGDGLDCDAAVFGCFGGGDFFVQGVVFGGDDALHGVPPLNA